MADEATGTRPDGVTAWLPKEGVSAVLPAAELTRRFAAGDAHVVDGHTYAMAGPDGEVWHVPAASVADAAGKGMVFVDHRTNVRAEVAKESGWQAAAQGALNVTTMGLGEAGLAAAGADPVALDARREQDAYTVGQAGGAVLGAMVAPQALLGKLAGTAAAETLGASALARITAAGVGTAVEGATYAAGNAVSEASLGRTEDVAEHVLAATGLGALLGAGGRGVGMLLGKGLKAAGSAALRGASRVAGDVADTEAAAVSGSLGAYRTEADTAAASARDTALRTHAPLDPAALQPSLPPPSATPLAPPTPTALSEAAGALAARAGRRAATSMAGGALGGPMGYVLGDVAGELASSPAVRAKVLAWARNATARVAQTIDDHAATLVSGGEAATATGRYLERRVAASTTQLIAAGTPAARRAAFDARMTELQELSDPATQTDVFDRATGHLADAMPDTRAMIQGRGAQTLAWLQAQVPRSVNPDQYDPTVTLGDHDIMRWSRLDAVAQDPMRALERGATKAEIDAVATLYPSLHATMQRAIGRVLKAGLSWDARKSLSYKWGVTSHNAFIAGSVAMSQQAYKANAAAIAAVAQNHRPASPSAPRTSALSDPTSAITGGM